MASVERLHNFLLRWEGGFVCDPDDLGGATNMGVTIETYRAYCRRNGMPHPSLMKLKRMTRKVWCDIVKSMYWDRFGADGIASQSVANICVDWLWMSGSVAIKRVQEIVGVKVDGIVGVKTLAAINSRSALPLFGAVKEARKEYIDEICEARPKNEKFRRGWLNRLEALRYED